MTRSEYEVKRQRIISQKRSLVMQVRQWKNRKPDYAAKLQAELDGIKTPMALPPIFGWSLYNQRGEYQGFTLDYNEVLTCPDWIAKKTKAVSVGHLPVA